MVARISDPQKCRSSANSFIRASGGELSRATARSRAASRPAAAVLRDNSLEPRVCIFSAPHSHKYVSASGRPPAKMLATREIAGHPTQNPGRAARPKALR